MGAAIVKETRTREMRRDLLKSIVAFEENLDLERMRGFELK